MTLMHKTALIVCGIFLVVSCTSCKKFSWSPSPYVGDSVNSQILRAGDGFTIKCDQPEFDRITCFDEEDIISLKNEIDKVNDKKANKKLKDLIKKVDHAKKLRDN